MHNAKWPAIYPMLSNTIILLSNKLSISMNLIEVSEWIIDLMINDYLMIEQTFDHVGIFLNEPVFSHGQLYVALSRSKNPNNIKVLITNARGQGKLLHDNRTFTPNVIYNEVFE
jgi:hypothetical protein